MAVRLAADGFEVGINSRRSEDALAAVATITAAGGRAFDASGDITTAAGVEEVAAKVRAVGTLDVLVANATGPQPSSPIADLDWESYTDQLTFFVKSPVLLLAAFLDDLTASTQARIVLVDSELATKPAVGMAAYGTAKNAQIGLMKTWSRELAAHDITVNCVAPGFIPVERHDGIDVSDYQSSVPLGRMGLPDDIANAVSFFCAPASGFVTGQRLVVDGGRHLA